MSNTVAVLIQDERTKKLLAWAVRFSRMQLDVEDVRYAIRAHVAKIVEHISQQPDLSVASDAEVREIAADRATMLTQLDILQAKAITVTVTAKLEEAQNARSRGGKATVQARKQDAGTRKEKVEGAAWRLRSSGTKNHRLISEIMKITDYSRTTVKRYLPDK